MKIKLLAVATLMVWGLAACTGGSGKQKVLIFAASSLTESFGALEDAFEAENPDIDVVLNFASSATLRTQIQEGAAADVYASANGEHMSVLVEAGIVKAESVKVFAINRLAIVVPEGNPGNIQGAKDLAVSGQRLVLAQPEVPAGSYARQALAEMEELYGPDYATQVLANVVSNEQNVRQVLVKVELGEADGGFVYRTDALASGEVEWFELPADYGPFAHYPIGIVANTKTAAGAQEFLDFVLSAVGQTILENWGFESADGL